MKVRAYVNHFGLVMSSVIAICVSLVMASSAIIVDQLTFSIPLLIKNWGTSYLVITFTGMIFPLTEWSYAICNKFGIELHTFKMEMIANTINTLFFNTSATLILAAVNILGDEGIAAAITAGHLPFESPMDMYIKTCIRDWPIMFVISFIVAYIVTKFAQKIATDSVTASKEQVH